MKFRGLIIAVLVLSALGGLLYWSNHHKPSPESTASTSPASPYVLKMDQGSITQLSFERKGAEPVTLVKANAGKWQITEPKALNADQDEVSGVLSTLSSLSSDRLVDQKASDLKQYGLDDPSLTLEITSADHRQRKLLLGDDTPAGGDVYAMLAGDPRVYTIASYNKTSLEKGLNDLRDKRLVTIAPDKVSRVALQKKPQTIEFARIKDGWQILKPQPMRADSFAVDEFVRSVTDARMDLSGHDSDHAAADFAKATPVATVTLTGDQGVQTLDVRKNKNDYYAKSNDVEGIYKVDASLGTTLSQNLDGFRDKKLFDFGYEDPSKIELHEGPKSWFLMHSGTDWWSNGKKMDSSNVESVVDKLRDLQATGFPTSGFSTPVFEATVVSNDGKRVDKVLISRSGDSCIAKRENEAALYQLSSSALTDLMDAADALKPAVKAAK
jgi:Domain of unknown function (DUF4340)